MILTAHQPTYLPWLGLFNKISYSDVFVFFDTVQYLPKEWMNRNYIRSKDEKILLTVPVKKKNYLNKKINEIQINYDSDWKRKHLKSLTLCYHKQNFFELYFDQLENIYNKNFSFLSDLNFELLKFFLKNLDIETKILKASNYDFKGKKSDLVLDMCLKLKASKFIFGEQGINYANKESFKKKKIKIAFQNYIHPIYSQNSKNFISNLSILDLIFNHGKDSLKIINKNQKKLTYL